MFDWARWSSLRRMIDAKVPGAAHDGWLEGWTVGFAQHDWKIGRGLAVLDVRAGDEARPYLDAYRCRDASVVVASPDALPSQSAQFDLVTLFSFERACCLRQVDFAQPFARLGQLLAAAALLKPGGVLFWSYPYAFPGSPEEVREILDPAATHQALTLRGFLPLAPQRAVAERLTIYHGPDTLFVDQQHVLEHAESQCRVVRVFGAVSRPGAVTRVRSLHLPEVDELGTRMIGKVLARRVAAKIGRWISPRGGRCHV